jgi:iron complex transport system substrate-binding protein
MERHGIRCRMAGPVLLLSFIIVATATAAPVAAVDDQGRRLALPRPARRVVSLAPNVTEMLFAVGAGAQVVGVTRFCDHPAAARTKPKIGNFSTPDLEAVAAARPDLVVAAHGNSLEGIAGIRRLKIPVFVTNPKGTDGVLRNMVALGTLTGHAAPARRATTALTARLKRLDRALRGRPARRALVVVWPDPMTVVGGRSYVNEAIRRAGGINVAGGIGEAYPKLDPERVITLEPEVLLFPTDRHHGAIERLAQQPGVADTPAGRARRLYALHGEWLLRAGPRLVAGIEEMARRLHPDAFPATKVSHLGR